MRQALQELGHRVTVVSPMAIEWADGRIETVGNEWVRGTLVDRLVARTRLPFRKDPPIVKLIHWTYKRDRFDVFEIEESFGWAAHLKLDSPVIVRLHGPHFLGKDENESAEAAADSCLRIEAEGRGIAAADGITSPSAAVLSATLNRYGVGRRHAETIFNPMPVAPDAERWSIKRCNSNQILFVGRFDLRKGADIAIKAFLLAAERNSKLRMVMCGPDTGLAQPSGHLMHFADYISASLPDSVRARIEYRGVEIPEVISSLRLQSALSVSASRFETFHYSITEALALGMPLVASSTFGISEVIRNGQNGFIFPNGDHAALAATLDAALGDHSRLAAIGAAGHALCEDSLDPTRIAEKTIKFYQSFL